MRVAIENGKSGQFEEVLPELMYTAVLPYLGSEAAAEELTIQPSAAVLGPVSGG